MFVLDPQELALARADLISSWPDTAHVLRGGSAGPNEQAVQPVTATTTTAAVTGGVSDGRGGFRFTTVPAVPAPDLPPGTPAPLPGRDVEIGNYPCSVRSMPRPAMELMQAERITERQLYKLSLPFGIDVDIKDKVQVSRGRADIGWTAYPGGPTFDPNGTIYEVTGLAPQRSDALSYQVHVELWQ